MNWHKARVTTLAFLGFAFAIYWMATSELPPVGSDHQEANLSPRSKMLDQLHREAQGLSVRELVLLKRTALAAERSEQERLRAIYTISLSPKAVARKFLREIAQAPLPQSIRVRALESLNQLDKKFQAN
ncbi:MAG: hypothetical protein HC883_01295 [Bdellovibrionaceae bacterium]|nr:hypothetical protein [Pseudobdellovibrionaceae bacterium]